MAVNLRRLIVNHMKKFLFIIIVILLAVEFRDHPAIKPYMDKIVGLVKTEAKRNVGISEFPALIKDLESLENSIALHEMEFIKQDLTSLKKAQSFFNKYCHNIELSHTALTSYAIRKTCGILEKHLPTT